MPARLPASVKAAKGTARTSRTIQQSAADRLLKSPPPPPSLGPDAAKEWGLLASILVEARTLTRADLRALELLCETLASATRFAEIVAKEGATVPGGSGGTKAHPALQAMATARAQARALFTDFGLTPKAREAVSQAPGGRETKPWHYGD